MIDHLNTYCVTTDSPCLAEILPPSKDVFRIGVMGAASGHISKEAKTKAYHLGELIAEAGHKLITGATNGLPLYAAQGAHSKGGDIYGMSPAKNATDHQKNWHLPLEPHTFITYTGLGFDFRDHLNIFNSEIVIFAGGGIGTLNEFTLAYHEGKIMGVLLETGGIERRFESILDALAYRTSAKLFFADTPEEILRLTLAERKLGLDESIYHYE